MAQLAELDLLSWLAEPAGSTTADLAWHSLDDLRGLHEEGIGDASDNTRPADGIVSWLAVLGGTPAGGEGGATAVNNWLAGSML